MPFTEEEERTQNESCQKPSGFSDIWPSEPVNETLLERKVLETYLSWELQISLWMSQVDSKPVMSVLMRDRGEGVDTGRDHGITEAEIGVLAARGHWSTRSCKRQGGPFAGVLGGSTAIPAP